MSAIPSGKHWSEVRSVRDLVHQLRRERKAALRECGHLGEKLHTARLEITLQRQQTKEVLVELHNLGLAVADKEMANEALRQRIKELEALAALKQHLHMEVTTPGDHTD